MAKALYNSITQTKDSDSAGTQVELPGQTLLERTKERPGASYVIDVMKEEGSDVSGYKRTQITQEMLNRYDLVVSMAAKSYTPSWLLKSSKYRYWDIPDPMGKNYKVTALARDRIKKKIEEELIKS